MKPGTRYFVRGGYGRKEEFQSNEFNFTVIKLNNFFSTEFDEEDIFLWWISPSSLHPLMTESWIFRNIFNFLLLKSDEEIFALIENIMGRKDDLIHHACCGGNIQNRWCLKWAYTRREKDFQTVSKFMCSSFAFWVSVSYDRWWMTSITTSKPDYVTSPFIIEISDFSNLRCRTCFVLFWHSHDDSSSHEILLEQICFGIWKVNLLVGWIQ